MNNDELIKTKRQTTANELGMAAAFACECDQIISTFDALLYTQYVEKNRLLTRQSIVVYETKVDIVSAARRDFLRSERKQARRESRLGISRRA